MIMVICMIWIGMQLNAPVWYYCLLGLILFLNVISYGLRMFNKGKTSVNKETQESR